MCIADMIRARENVLRMQLDSALSKVEELKTENAKLRELVKDIEYAVDPFMLGFIECRMNELGIEVDE